MTELSGTYRTSTTNSTHHLCLVPFTHFCLSTSYLPIYLKLILLKVLGILGRPTICSGSSCLVPIHLSAYLVSVTYLGIWYYWYYWYYWYLALGILGRPTICSGSSRLVPIHQVISGGGNPPIAWNKNIVIIFNAVNVNVAFLSFSPFGRSQFVCEYFLPFVGLGCTIYFVGLYYVSWLSMKVI